VHEKIKDNLIKLLQHYIKEFYEGGNTHHKDMGLMVNNFHAKRVQEMVDSSGGKIICGAKGDPSKRFMAPTIIDSPDMDSKLMTEEIFGPILPVITFTKIDDAINHIN
jgi:aldehyde dehydrogenase (NAD+)